MWVQPVDYLRILEGGYFLHFVAMAIVPADMVSLVQGNRLLSFRMADVEHVKAFSYSCSYTLLVVMACVC